jgi:hypothetical protein
MALSKIQFRPGIDKQTTQYGAEGQWVDSKNIRFRSGLPEKIGGWATVITDTFVGVARAMIGWVSLTGIRYVAIGTDQKLYLYSEGSTFDITPLRLTATLNNPFTTNSGQKTASVTHTAHGAQPGDYVTFTGTGTVGGLNFIQEFCIKSITNSNAYVVEFTNPATAASSSTSGGGTVVAKYQITPGTATSSYGLGWGTGPWIVSASGGTRAWNTPASASSLVLDATTWSFDTFGEDLLALRNDGTLYKWDLSVGTGTPAVVQSGAPTKSRFLIVSDNRHVLLFGTETTIGNTTTQDNLFLRFSSQEDPSNWNPQLGNSAGTFRIQDGSKIIQAARSRGSILVWTDTALHSLNNIGAPFIFGLNQIGSNCGAVSAHCAVDINGTSFWMSQTAFFMFDGAIKKIPCSVQDFVFDNIDSVSQQQVFSAVNTDFNEVTWFYPSSGSSVLDQSVTYNYAEQVWTTNTGFIRTSWFDRGIYGFPYATDYTPNSKGTVGNIQNVPDGKAYLYQHEFEFNADGAAMPCDITSGDFDIEDGETIFHTSRVIPDFKNQVGNANITITFANYPASTAVRTFTSTVNSSTLKFATRGRGRQANLKIESSDVNDNWRFGTIRLDIQPDGGR